MNSIITDDQLRTWADRLSHKIHEISNEDDATFMDDFMDILEAEIHWTADVEIIYSNDCGPTQRTSNQKVEVEVWSIGDEIPDAILMEIESRLEDMLN